MFNPAICTSQFTFDEQWFFNQFSLIETITTNSQEAEKKIKMKGVKTKTRSNDDATVF